MSAPPHPVSLTPSHALGSAPASPSNTRLSHRTSLETGTSLLRPSAPLRSKAPGRAHNGPRQSPPALGRRTTILSASCLPRAVSLRKHPEPSRCGQFPGHWPVWPQRMTGAEGSGADGGAAPGGGDRWTRGPGGRRAPSPGPRGAGFGQDGAAVGSAPRLRPQFAVHHTPLPSRGTLILVQGDAPPPW